MNGQTDICFIKFHEALLHCLGPIASFDSGYNVCTSLLLWVNVPNAYINTFWRSSHPQVQEKEECVRKILVPRTTTE